MSTADTYHLSTRAAEGYERQKVRFLFCPMARACVCPRLTDAGCRRCGRNHAGRQAAEIAEKVNAGFKNIVF